jgi:hypothetical protein
MEYLLLNPSSVLNQMLRLMIIRRHYSTSGDSYETMYQLWPEWFPDFVLEYNVSAYEWNSNSSCRQECRMNILDLLRSMKLNCEDQDACSLLSADIFAELKAQARFRTYQRMAHRAALAMVHFGSRRFLQALGMQVREHGKVTTKLIHRIIMEDPQPELLYTTSFNPNRIRRSEISRKPSLKAKRYIMKKKWSKLQSRVQPFSFGDGRVFV